MKHLKHYHAPKPYQRFLYVFSQGVCNIYFKLFWRTKVVGLENIPKEGGVLLASNHASFADPPLIGTYCPRNTYFFAKEELFKVPIMGWFIRQINAFPVRRFDHDIGAFKKAQQLLEAGQAVLVFPEGRRSKTGELGKAKAGVGMLAYKAKCPVVPVYIHNSNRMTEFKKVTITFGKPIFPEDTEHEKLHYQGFSDAVLNLVADLKTKMV